MLALQDRDGANAIVNEYTWGLNLGGGIGGLLNLAQGGQNYSYLYDGKGNVEAMLDPTQTVVSAYRYDPFGRLLAQSSSLIQPFQFSTKRYNAQAGMLHYQYRNYLPQIGRWDSRDPLGEAGGINLYAFAGNNPVNWVDPFGLAVTSYDAAIESCLEQPNLKARLDCLEGLLEIGADECKIGKAIDAQKKLGKVLETLGKKAAKAKGKQAATLLKKLANKAGLKVVPGGKHLKVVDAAGKVITLIPHSPHGAGTIKDIKY